MSNLAVVHPNSGHKTQECACIFSCWDGIKVTQKWLKVTSEGPSNFLTFSLLISEAFWVFLSFLSDRSVLHPPTNVVKILQSLGNLEKSQKSSLISKDKVNKEEALFGHFNCFGVLGVLAGKQKHKTTQCQITTLRSCISQSRGFCRWWASG